MLHKVRPFMALNRAVYVGCVPYGVLVLYHQTSLFTWLMSFKECSFYGIKPRCLRGLRLPKGARSMASSLAVYVAYVA